MYISVITTFVKNNVAVEIKKIQQNFLGPGLDTNFRKTKNQNQFFPIPLLRHWEMVPFI